MLPKAFVLFLLYVTAAEAGTQQYRWIDEVGSCKLHYIPATWQEARLRCNVEGGVMASTSKPTQLKRLMEEFGVERVFLGIHDTFTGEYYSLDGTPLDSIDVKWTPKEPDNFEASESCLALNSNGTVADVKCTHLLPYICCKDTKKASDKKAETNGYICEESLESCYKFHRMGNTWTNAFRACASESAQLAIVNSKWEAQYLVDMVSKIPSSTMTAQYTDFAYIGFRAWDKPPIWLTIHGQQLDEAGYLAWGPTQLGNSTDFKQDGEICGSFIFKGQANEAGKYNEVSCEKFLTYICERKMSGMSNESNIGINSQT